MVQPVTPAVPLGATGPPAKARQGDGYQWDLPAEHRPAMNDDPDATMRRDQESVWAI